MIMLTKVVNNNKPEQRAKSMHIFIFCLFKVSYMYKFKSERFAGFSRGKSEEVMLLCFIYTYIQH